MSNAFEELDGVNGIHSSTTVSPLLLYTTIIYHSFSLCLHSFCNLKRPQTFYSLIL